jgi:hypothetical protein
MTPQAGHRSTLVPGAGISGLRTALAATAAIGLFTTGRPG